MELDELGGEANGVEVAKRERLEREDSPALPGFICLVDNFDICCRRFNSSSLAAVVQWGRGGGRFAP